MKFIKTALKTFWAKCGEERFSLKVMLTITTLLTLNAITTLDNSPAVNGLIILTNAVMFMIYLFGEDEK